MPSAAYSLASVRAKPVTAARTELERSSPSTGCFTAEEVIVMRRPHFFFCMRGKASLAKKTVLIRSCSMAERQSSGLVFNLAKCFQFTTFLSDGARTLQVSSVLENFSLNESIALTWDSLTLLTYTFIVSPTLL